MGKEKPKLDNARRLRGIYFVDPDDREYSEILKMQEENWKDLWLPRCRRRPKIMKTTLQAKDLLRCRDVTRNSHTSLDVMLEKVSMTIGTLMEIETCQMRGQDSGSSLC